MAISTEKEHWTLDRRIPLGFLVGVALQTAVFAFWMGGLQAQVDANTAELRDKKEDGSRLSVMENEMRSLNRSIAELKTYLEELRREIRQR